MAKRKLESNTDLVMDLMTYSSAGPITQMFIVDAITKLSNAVAATPIEKLREQFGPNAFVNPDAWKAAAVDIKTRMDAFYKR